MAKIDVEPVLGAKNHSDLANPEAVGELVDELDDNGLKIYSGLGPLLAAERRAKRQAEGYGNVINRKVTDKLLRQALRSAVRQ